MRLDGSWNYILNVAESRLAHNKTPRHISDYGDALEIIGAAGELAARRMLGLEEDLHTGFDNGIDFMFAGFAIDVKSTKLTPQVSHRYLQWPVWKRIHSDIVLLMAVDTDNQFATPLGWAWKREIEVSPVNENRPSPCHEIPVTDLYPLFMLYEIYETRLWRGKKETHRE